MPPKFDPNEVKIGKNQISVQSEKVFVSDSFFNLFSNFYSLFEMCGRRSRSHLISGSQDRSSRSREYTMQAFHSPNSNL